MVRKLLCTRGRAAHLPFNGIELQVIIFTYDSNHVFSKSNR